jgi:hypothetical protein
MKTMTEKVKGKTKAQKATEKVTKATEKMHTDVTASLDQLQHHDVKTGAHKAIADAKKAPPKAGSPSKKIAR